jgi:hypothetical protein
VRYIIGPLRRVQEQNTQLSGGCQNVCYICSPSLSRDPRAAPSTPFYRVDLTCFSDWVPPVFDLNPAGEVDDRSGGPYSEIRALSGGEHRTRWNVGGIVASAHAVWARSEGTRQFDKEAQSQID